MAVGKKKEPDSAPALSPVPVSSKKHAYLGQGCFINGTMKFSGPAELDGSIEGEVQAKDKLTIGESAVVNATISGSEIVVKGTVNGDISAAAMLTLVKPARVTGNISTSCLTIEQGVVFEGNCSMIKGAPLKTADSKKN